ncbi:MAG: hypothetical protein ABI594_11695 [Ginsengibacter sp.]
MNAAFMVTIIITVCLILFLLFFKRKKPQQNSKIIPSVTHKKDSATKQDTAAIKNFVPADPKRPNKIIPENKKSEKVNFTPPDSINVEEKVKQEKEKTEIKKNDSLTVKKPALPVLKPAKSKGVEGISDSDYRINIKNDSLKKK